MLAAVTLLPALRPWYRRHGEWSSGTLLVSHFILLPCWTLLADGGWEVRRFTSAAVPLHLAAVSVISPCIVAVADLARFRVVLPIMLLRASLYVGGAAGMPTWVRYEHAAVALALQLAGVAVGVWYANARERALRRCFKAHVERQLEHAKLGVAL